MDCEQITVRCNQTPHDEMICCKAMDLLEEKLVVQVTVDKLLAIFDISFKAMLC